MEERRRAGGDPGGKCKDLCVLEEKAYFRFFPTLVDGLVRSALDMAAKKLVLLRALVPWFSFLPCGSSLRKVVIAWRFLHADPTRLYVTCGRCQHT